MKSFDDWFKELTSDTRWVELLRHYKDDTIKKAGEKVYDEQVTLKTLGCRDIKEDRLHVYRVCKKGPEDKPKIRDWKGVQAEKEEQEKQKEWVPVTGEERARRLAEWEAIVKGSTMTNSMPKPSYKQLAEEGGVLPPKPAPYPVTKPEEAYVRDRHFEWIKNNFEARTGQKLPNWICEEEWNIVYDEKHLTDKGL